MDGNPLSKASTDRAYVRTGYGGREVVLAGGMFVLPILHQVVSVSLGLSKVVLKAEQDAGLITSDRILVDVDAEFFLRVSPNAEAAALAASTLGALTNRPEDLAAFYESEFLGALRSVAAEQSPNALHENRAGFIEAVQSRVAPVLARNGWNLARSRSAIWIRPRWSISTPPTVLTPRA